MMLHTLRSWQRSAPGCKLTPHRMPQVPSSLLGTRVTCVCSSHTHHTGTLCCTVVSTASCPLPISCAQNVWDVEKVKASGSSLTCLGDKPFLHPFALPLGWLAGERGTTGRTYVRTYAVPVCSPLLCWNDARNDVVGGARSSGDELVDPVAGQQSSHPRHHRSFEHRLQVCPRGNTQNPSLAKQLPAV